jgi:TonB-linked SusC/RagA family outer membrane protein
MGKLLRLLVTLVTAVCVATPALAQERGTITGTVTADGQPLVGASVLINGMALRAVTSQGGEFRIANVPAGSHDVTASILGYAPRTQRVTLAAGGTATTNFQLTASALEIGGLVVTATGREQRQREIGSSVAVVSTADVELAPVTNASQLIQGRVAGAVVTQSGGTTGGGARVRIRGNNSMSLSNAPLIIIDGVRVESAEASLGFGVGGQSPSRLNDINPEDVENIEVLKGPAAAALYGTAAANGVIQITTKRGRAGRPEFRVWSEYGRLENPVTFPENTYAQGNLITATGRPPATGAVGRCDIIRQAIGSRPTGNQIGCTGVTETFTFNPLENAETTPFKDGNRRTLGGSISGGAENATFYVSAEAENELGIQPDNELDRIRVQANTTGRFGEKLNIGASISYLNSDLQLPQADNALFGIVPMGLFGSPRPQFVESQQGFESNPQFFYDWKTFQSYGRFTGSLRGDYRPLSWLSLNGTTGLDRYAREDRNRIPRSNAYGPVFQGIYTNGWIQNYNYDIWNLTNNGSATAVFNVSEDLVSTSAVGTQYIREHLHRIYAFGAGLTPGVDNSLGGSTSDFSASEINVLNATVSGYLQQQFAWRDRVYVNAAVRGDQNTSFGNNIGWIWYPSFSGSWVVSEEPFFPEFGFLSNLRLRAAYGQSGLRPGPADAQTLFTTATTTFANSDAAAITFPGAGNVLGNPDLKPERSAEWEFGFESQFLENRLGLDLTYFNKTSTNALIRRDLPASLGAPPFRFENLGEVNNSGLELRLSAQPVRTDLLQLDVNVTGSLIRNELIDLGLDAQGNPIQPVLVGTGSITSRQRHTKGFPLGSYFDFPITSYADADGNGLLSPTEVTVRRDTVVFLGNPFPDRELSFNTNLRVGQWATVSAMLDYKGGHEMLNVTRAWRCTTNNKANCAELYDTGTSLETQAAIVAQSFFGSYAGFVEKADFVKLRELALTVGLPKTLAERFGANGLSLTLAGRNLKTWTDYTGLDPEINYGGQTNFTTAEFGSLPPNRLYTLRLDANF